MYDTLPASQVKICTRTCKASLILSRRAWKHKALKTALKKYLKTDQSLKDIAHQHSCCPATLTYWIHKLGLPQRAPGRRKLRNPTKKHLRMINLVRRHGIVKTARREGISKQRTSQIVLCWAPELKGRHKKLRHPAAPKRREPRKIVVSFRLSENEWQLLKATPPMPRWPKMSVFAKARAIVLKHLAVRVGWLHSLGLLIVDELQHLNQAKSGGAERMLNFFLQLMNTVAFRSF